MSTSRPVTAVNRWGVLSGAVIALLMGGTLYSFSVFAKPFAELRGWAMPDVMQAFGFTSMLAPVAMIGAGYFLDRGRTQLLMIAGGVLFGAGHVLAGLVTSIGAFWLCFGLIAGLGQGMMYSAALSNTLKLFPDKRGLASGMITGGMGAGSVIAAPVGRAMVSSIGVSQSFVVLGAVYAVVVVLAAVLLIRQAPVGYAPAGWSPPAPVGGGAPTAMNWRQMIRTPQFWIIVPMFVAGAFFGLMITSNLSGISQDMFGATAASAALFVSLLGACNTIGRISWGWVSDRIGITTSLMIVFVLAAAALVLLGAGAGTLVLAAGVIVLGFAFGGVMSLFPPLTMANYGPRHQGVNYGIVFSAYALSGLVAPKWAASIAEGSGGDFSSAFYIAAAIAVCGLVLTLLYRGVTARRSAAASVVVEREPVSAP
ncbi:MAG: hypothetical protein BGO96_14485 [Micrococcales bacterium 73-15]|uniref:L-lactate MFS transporter n=1 Tax=Salana multivorans TaxID=120377 RepID=UPI0009613DD8|nr:OFA family MFS transporter [Salana multivorans]OJX98071.1 MAG: hypothetical protein BGO96_14485 [Micrococcales bacterium 73-15]